MDSLIKKGGEKYTYVEVPLTTTYATTIDLGAQKDIAFLSVYSNAIYSGGNSSVNVSNDGTTWTALYSNHASYNHAHEIGKYRYIKTNIRISGTPTNSYLIYIYK